MSHKHKRTNIIAEILHNQAIDKAEKVMASVLYDLSYFYKFRTDILELCKDSHKRIECEEGCKKNCKQKAIAMLQLAEALNNCFPDLKDAINNVFIEVNAGLEACVAEAPDANLPTEPYELL